jgi:S1-C subfamily serine protease
MKSSFSFSPAIAGLAGAVIGSTSMMMFSAIYTGHGATQNGSPAIASAAEMPAASSDQQRIVDAVKLVRPSVVSLLVTVNGTRTVAADPFSQFFGGQNAPSQPQQFKERASGSGFVYNNSGLILTNAHVVPHGTTSVTVVFENGDHVPGKVFSSDPGADLALVKVDHYAKLPAPVQFADSSTLNAGQWAIAIGEPFELKQSVAVGVVSGFDRDEPIQDDNGQTHLFRGMLQTSAPINPGNSGGPLVDDAGRVIGVNQSVETPQAGAQGIGFAIPANVVTTTAALLEKSQGKTLDANSTGTGVAYLGVGLSALSSTVRTQISYPVSDGGGVLIGQIPPNGPAAKVDLSPGDIIQKIDGKAVSTPEDVMKEVKSRKPGQTASLEVWSAGTKKLVFVPLGEQPADVYMEQQAQ